LKAVKGYEGRYFVTARGEIYSAKRKTPLKPNDNGTGYMSVLLYKNGEAKRVYIHRIVAEAFLPNPFCLPVVNHINTDTRDNRARNLEWMDQKDNIAHSRKLGNQNDRPIKATHVETGEAFAFSCLREAEKQIFNGSDILRKHIKRKGLNFSHSGYVWEVQK
jgi:hypothetical protein